MNEWNNHDIGIDETDYGYDDSIGMQIVIAEKTCTRCGAIGKKLRLECPKVCRCTDNYKTYIDGDNNIVVCVSCDERVSFLERLTVGDLIKYNEHCLDI